MEEGSVKIPGNKEPNPRPERGGTIFKMTGKLAAISKRFLNYLSMGKHQP